MKTKKSTSAVNFILSRCCNLFVAALFIFLISSNQKANGQICVAGTPVQILDLTGHPDTSLTTAVIPRGGSCCGTSNCVDFDLTLDNNTVAMTLVVNGASADGSFTMNLDCGDQNYGVGSVICITTAGHHDLTICKPGGNSYSFTLTAVATPTFPTSDTTRIGCSTVMNVLGLVQSSITWQSVAPGNPGDYNSYLSCTSACSSSTFSPQTGSPDSIDYQICGNITAAGCNGLSSSTVCQTVRMYVATGVVVSVDLPTVSLNCNNPSAVVTATAAAGTSLLWSPGGQTTDTIQVSSANTYTVTATSNAYGCTSATATATSTVSADFSTPNLACGSGVSLTCTNPSAKIGVTAASGVTFLWNGTGIVGDNTADSINVNTEGIYSVVATKTSSGCTATCSIDVTQDFNAPNVTCGAGINLTCTNPTGTIGANTSSLGATGVTFTWSGPGIVGSNMGNSITVNTAGTYTVVATEGLSGCSSTCTTVVTQDFSTPGLTCGSGDNLTCVHTVGSVGVTAVSGVTFAWSGPGIVGDNTGSSINMNVEGTYSVVATKTSSGCTATCSAIVTQDFSTPGLTCGGGDNLTCTHTVGTVGVTAVSGVTFAWSGPGIVGSNTGSSINMNVAGTYSVVATKTSSGCTSTCSAIVTQDVSTPGLTCGGGDNLTCTHTVGSVGVTAVSGVTFAWSGPSIVGSSTGSSINMNAPGTYSVVATKTSSGCTATCSAIVTQDISTPGLTCGSGDNLTCVHTIGTVGVTAVSGVTFAWSGPGIVGSATGSSINMNVEGTYSVVATKTSSGCTATCSAIVTQDFSTPGLTCGSGDNLTCTHTVGSVGVTAVSGVTFEWSGPGIVGSNTGSSINMNVAGTYSVVATKTSSGCTATCSANVTQDVSTPGLTCGGGDKLTCTHTTGSVGVDAVSGVTFAWSGPSIVGSTTGSSINMNVAGTYSVVATKTSSGCTATCSAIVTQDISSPSLVCGAGYNLTCVHTTGTIGVTAAAGVTFAWSGPGIVGSNTGSSINMNVEGTYSVVATKTSSGCTQSCSINVTQNFTVSQAHAGPDYVINCTTPEVNLSANAIPTGVSYNWTAINGGHIVSGGTTAAPLVNAAGCYILTTTVTASGCTSRDTACVTGNTIHPNCNIIAPTAVPDSNTAGYTLTSNSTNANTYHWSVTTLPSNKPWVITSAINGTSITYTSGTGVAVFSLVVVNTSNGCTDSCSLAVGVNGTKFCMYGQGAYGNAGGKYCSNLTTTQLMTDLLSTPLPLGGGNNSITFYQTDVSCIISRLPGGGGFAALDGIATCANPVGIRLFPHNGRYRNGLLSQTITYALNIRICNIGNVVIAGPYMVTYGSGGNGACCVNSGIDQGSAQTTVIPIDVWNYLKTSLGRNPTFNDVLNFANEALAGTYVPSRNNPGLPDIAGAEDAISSAFDGCQILAGFSTTPLRSAEAGETKTTGTNYEMSISVFPNPFNNQSTIQMVPDADYDHVSVELYNINGAKVSMFYEGAVEAGKTYQWVINGASLAGGMYMYRIIADEDIYNGKIVLIR